MPKINQLKTETVSKKHRTRLTVKISLVFGRDLLKELLLKQGTRNYWICLNNTAFLNDVNLGTEGIKYVRPQQKQKKQKGEVSRGDTHGSERTVARAWPHTPTKWAIFTSSKSREDASPPSPCNFPPSLYVCVCVRLHRNADTAVRDSPLCIAKEGHKRASASVAWVCAFDITTSRRRRLALLTRESILWVPCKIP